jgi:hypothetical protein
MYQTKKRSFPPRHSSFGCLCVHEREMSDCVNCMLPSYKEQIEMSSMVRQRSQETVYGAYETALNPEIVQCAHEKNQLASNVYLLRMRFKGRVWPRKM